MALCLYVGVAFAQVSFEGFEEQLTEEVGEREKFEALLSDPSEIKRRAAMDLMLSSGVPYLREMAINFGLYADDPDLRAAAIRGILNAAPRLRYTIAPEDGAEETVFGWLRWAGGSHNDDVGNLSIPVAAYDDEQKCWPTAWRGRCGFVHNGDTVQLTMRSSAATLTLGRDGILRGRGWFTYSSRTAHADVAIDLSE